MSTQFSWTVDPTFACWLWTGRADKRDGRAMVWRGKTPVSAQRAVYEDHVGPIPDGLELDHMCRRPACVAPHHAEPVTRSENEKRKLFSYRIKRKQCPNGHDLALQRVITPEGGIVCRECNKNSQQ